ncbi:MAG: DUF1343 domain-containing protein [Verrucomicrobia bacterium]|nr:DUF1343 domain-containing protein [Verrucomicrobiota bacterium]
MTNSILLYCQKVYGVIVKQTTSFLCLLLLFVCRLYAVDVGLDLVFQPPYNEKIKGKKIGLITNHTAVNKNLQTSIQLFLQEQEAQKYELIALFAPEHGLYGDAHAGANVASSKSEEGLPIHSLHGLTRRPTADMLKGLSLLVFDIQDLGTRSYTYETTLFYAMEEAAKRKIPVLVLDRPNPINGLIIDGPMLEKDFKSFIGYIDIPYCHGMTIGELARYFNEEYKIGCDLSVVPMRGWKRWMSFEDTGLHWIPTSPNIPEPTTACFYPMTGLIGDMRLVSIGVGYTLPFKVVGAPFINPKTFAEALNARKLPGVAFYPFRFQPTSGSFAAKPCKGVLIKVTNPQRFLPVTTGYAVMSTLKEQYPKEMAKALRDLRGKPELFFKACGTEKIFATLEKEKKPFNKLTAVHSAERQKFLETRAKYLAPDY